MRLINSDITRSMSVEVPLVSATTTQVNFPDIPILRNRFFIGIEAAMNSICPSSGKTNVFSQSTFDGDYSSFLTLIDKDGFQFVQNMPCTELRNTNYFSFSGSTFFAFNSNGLYLFNDRVVVWNKCSIYLPSAYASGATSSFLFNVYYK